MPDTGRELTPRMTDVFLSRSANHAGAMELKRRNPLFTAELSNPDFRGLPEIGVATRGILGAVPLFPTWQGNKAIPSITY